MISWRLFIHKLFCMHKWEIIKVVDLYRFNQDGEVESKIGYNYHLECRQCGKISKCLISN